MNEILVASFYLNFTYYKKLTFLFNNIKIIHNHQLECFYIDNFKIYFHKLLKHTIKNLLRFFYYNKS